MVSTELGYYSLSAPSFKISCQSEASKDYQPVDLELKYRVKRKMLFVETFNSPTRGELVPSNNFELNPDHSQKCGNGHIPMLRFSYSAG